MTRASTPRPRRILVAPDKFRGSASARVASNALAAGARQADWDVDLCPLSDGGEGFLDVLGGANRLTQVTGPLGQRTLAQWRRDGATAIIESAQACGAALAPSPRAQEAVESDSTGVGELINAALDEGATTIIVGVGGSATTDGGRGALNALRGRIPFDQGIDVLAAVDVTAPFLDAALVYARQKGADDDAVALLGQRLLNEATSLRALMGRDVLTAHHTGAGGGLAGGLWAAGARVESGFSLVARHQRVASRIARADLVISGEGRFDATSLAGKVTGALLTMTREAVRPFALVAGDVDHDVEELREIETWSLTSLFGTGLAHGDVEACLRDVAYRICREERPEVMRNSE